jgi:hypothetical protein
VERLAMAEMAVEAEEGLLRDVFGGFGIAAERA